MFCDSKTVINFFSTFALEESEKNYISYHAKRYAEIINIIADFKQPDCRILDIGPAFQTVLIKHFFPEIHIDTLGYHFGKVTYQNKEKHFFFNLNSCQHSNEWIKTDFSYDIVIFTEVLEHLYVSPTHVLNFIYSLIKTDGILVLQTPNAVTLPYRILMLVGRNPFMLLSENEHIHGHFREHTMKEMSVYLTKSNFKIVKAYFKNYFYRNNFLFSIFIISCYFLPPSFRQGMTFIVRKL
ncbi:MAG: class I SAM-dependent methyltransferase [Bacteroidales bacterium]|nr:class I SAM-dependent methyltransferase [Bacteroidales bacterium]